MISKRNIIDFAGYGGGSLSLIAYFLMTNNFIQSNLSIYLPMNIVAGVSLMIYTFTKKAYANTILNFIWSVVTVLAIIRAGLS